MTITIIGAGVAGLTTALALSERGAEVQILEQGMHAGANSCSRYAGGMLAPWCERESADELVLTLGQESIDYRSKILPGTLRNGTLVVAQSRDCAELDRFARQTSGHQLLDGAAITALEPDLDGRFRRGLLFRDEAHVDPRAALPALAGLLAARGVPIEVGVDGRNQTSSQDRIVDCRGLAARDALKDLRGVKGEMLLVRCPDVKLSRPVRLLHPRPPFYVVPRGEGVFMLGATMIESDDRKRITTRSMVELLNSAYALHPAFAEAEIIEIGIEARPAFPNNLPRIRQIGSTLHVNGQFRHGFLLAAALARMVLGSLQAQIALQLLLDHEPSPLGRLVSVDLRTYSFGGFSFAAAPEPTAAQARFLALSELEPHDFVVELRDADETPNPISPMAHRISPPELADRILPADQRIVLCCRSGVRAFKAVGHLRARGYENLAVLAANMA